MLIFVKTKTGKTITVDVERTDLVSSVKAKLAESQGIAVAQISLVYAGKPLEDGKSLADYNIDREAILHLILKEAAPAAKAKVSEVYSASPSPCPSPSPAPAIEMEPSKGLKLPIEELDSKKKEDLLNSFAKDATSSNVEIVFSFDTTGSMAACLALVRKKVSETVWRLMKDIPNIRIGIIAHGDYCDDISTYTVRTLPLSNNVEEICNFVNSVGATGGGDSPEAYELALREARHVGWSENSAKALVVIGDEVRDRCNNPAEAKETEAEAEAVLTNSKVPHEPWYTTECINWWDELAALRDMGVKVYGVRALDNRHARYFYETGTVSIHFTSFDLIVQMFLAICYRESSSEQLKKFRQEMKDEGKMNKELEKIMDTLEQPNPEKVPEKEVGQDEPRGNRLIPSFHCTEPWYDLSQREPKNPLFKLKEGRWVAVDYQGPVVAPLAPAPVHFRPTPAPRVTLSLTKKEKKKLQKQLDRGRRKSFISKVTFGLF